MSGIYAVILSHDDSKWVASLDKLVSGSRRRGSDGTRITKLTREGFTELKNPEQLYRRTTADGSKHADYLAFLGCAYSKPISLDTSDAGPFVAKPNGDLAIAYDGVISGYTGSQLVSWLSANDPTENWADLASQLDGQFALIAIARSQPGRVYYAVKAKPLHVFYDSIGRGAIVTSTSEPLSGMYHATRNARPFELRPYTCGYFNLDGLVYEKKSLVRFPGEGSLVLSGGGLDTTVAAYDAKRRFPGERMELVYFNYGAKAAYQEYAATEALSAALTKRYGNSQTVSRKFDFPLLQRIAASNLTDVRRAVSISPTAGKASEWVPARNTVLLALAMSLAESYGFARIVTGINQDAATAYPDNDEEWHNRMQALVPYALGTDRFVKLDSPLSMLSKVEIVQRGEECKIPWAEIPSWSCYNGQSRHCGLCSSCRARRKAFKMAGVTDPTAYIA